MYRFLLISSFRTRKGGFFLSMKMLLIGMSGALMDLLGTHVPVFPPVLLGVSVTCCLNVAR